VDQCHSIGDRLNDENAKECGPGAAAAAEQARAADGGGSDGVQEEDASAGVLANRLTARCGKQRWLDQPAEQIVAEEAAAGRESQARLAVDLGPFE
jgi:hypothetical protein